MKNLCVPFILLSVLSLPLTVNAQKEKNNTFKGIKSIQMNTSSGNCILRKSTDGNVLVNLKYTYDDGQVEHEINQEGDKLVIKETFHGNNVRGSSNWTLTIPESTSVKFNTGSGDITAEGVKLDLRATTGSGNLLFTNCAGSIECTTGSGTMDLDEFSGDVDISVGSGSAKIVNAKGDIKVSCGSGNIRITDSKAAFAMTTGSGSVVGRNIVLSGPGKFNSGSGNTSVTLGASPSFDLSVNSGSGDAELNFNGNEIAGEIVMRAGKQNGSIKAPFDFDKVEEIVNGGNNNVTIKKTVVKGNSLHKIQIGTGSGDAILRN